MLAATGIYAVLSYRVARQRREIGIRIALGAGTVRVVVMVLAAGAWLVGAGLALGVLACILLGRVVKSQVFVVPENDATALVLAVSVLGVVAAVACFIPAARASRVNPLAVLRSE